MRNLVRRVLFHCIGREIGRKDYPNVHLPASAAKMINLSGKVQCYIRESFSDYARVYEYGSKIYVPNIQFTEAVRKLKPKLLVDVGANIGLSSLSLIQEFPSIVKVVGLEAELENYGVLKKNFKLWSESIERIRFKDDPQIEASLNAKFAVASATVGDNTVKQLSYLPGGSSASGTFAPTAILDGRAGTIDDSRPDLENIIISQERVQINQVLTEHGDKDDVLVVKIDIEGGEEELLSTNTEWLDRTAFLTIEVHDRFGVPRSSRPLLQKLLEYDFAIVPDKDILHCFNRKLLKI